MKEVGKRWFKTLAYAQYKDGAYKNYIYFAHASSSTRIKY